MTQPPSPPPPFDPYEKYRVEALERERLERETKEKYRPPEPAKGLGFGQEVLRLFYKFFELFEKTSNKGLTPTAEKSIRKNLLALKEAFTSMKQENKSQEAPFLNSLSILWHQILEDVLKFQRSTPLAKEFSELIHGIDTYPRRSEHTLGYYLMEYAGQTWLPFPFMELIQKLHFEYQNNPIQCQLTFWTTQIDALAKKMEE